MDVGSKLLHVRQCLLAMVCDADNVVLYGSAAADRYIVPSMRFGETGAHQDIDLMLVVADEDVGIAPLERFVYDLSAKVALPGAIVHRIKMMCNGLYGVSISVHATHICDVMLVPFSVDARVKTAFPRLHCSVQLAAFGGEKRLQIISCDEVVHRLECIVASKPMADELPIMSREKNGAAIAKATLRLQRLQTLREMGMVSTTPAVWTWPFYVDEKHGAPMKKKSRTVSTQTAVMPLASIRAMCEQFTETNVFAIQNAMYRRLSAIESKLANVETRCSGLVTVLNARVRRESNVAREAVSRASTVLKSFRTSSFLTATKPIKAMRDMTSLAADMQEVVKLKHCAPDVDPSLGDYLESYLRITRDLTVRGHLPFCLFKDLKEKEGVDEKKEDDTVLSRDAVVVNGMKMNLMASFMVFLRMMRLSNKQPDDMIRLPFATYGVWTKASRFAFSLARRIQEVQHFVKPKEMCVPIVSSEDGSIDFLVFTEEAESHTDSQTIADMHQTINQHLVPQLDLGNVQYIMHLFDNVIGSITCPLIAHIGQLKETLRVLNMTAIEMTTTAKEYIDEFSKTPFIAQVQSIKAVQDELVGLEKTLLNRDVFSWKRVAKKNKSKKKHGVL